MIFNRIRRGDPCGRPLGSVILLLPDGRPQGSPLRTDSIIFRYGIADWLQPSAPTAGARGRAEKILDKSETRVIIVKLIASDAVIAQSVERVIGNDEVGSSNLPNSSKRVS